MSYILLDISLKICQYGCISNIFHSRPHMKRNRVHWRFLGLLFTRLRPSYLALTRILTTVISIAALSVMGLHTPWAQSLSETLFQMPAQMFFNRGEEAGLAGV